MASRLIPSPDWFVGLDSLDLCRGGDWLDQLSVDLDPHDAGTDRGLTFTSPNWVQDPAKPISRINSSYPSHQACSFYYPNITKLPTIARVFISKQVWYESGGKETINKRVDAGTAKRKSRISKQRNERPRNLQRQLQRKGTITMATTTPMIKLIIIITIILILQLLLVLFSRVSKISQRSRPKCGSKPSHLLFVQATI